MAQKFNKVTTTSNFIKNLLASTYLPLIKTVRDTDYIIEGRLYVYKCEVIMCTKSGYIITGFKNAGDKRPRAEFEQRAEYFFGEKNDKLCTNFISNAAGYDYLTHERLGKYLRSLRDMYNLNLMPLYNCFSNQPLPRHHIYNDRIVSTGLNFNTKVFKVPIRFNTDYTICMENLGMTTFAPAFLKNNNLLEADNTIFGNDTDLTNKYLKLHREGVVLNMPNLRFKDPITIRFNNIPETKTIKYYLQEDKPIDVLHTDKWYRQIVAEPDEHLYIRTVDDDGTPTYKYYDFTPDLAPSNSLFPHDEVKEIDYEITKEKFDEDPSKYFYVARIDGIMSYDSEDIRDEVLSICEEKRLSYKYNIYKYEEIYPHEDEYSKVSIILRLDVPTGDSPEDIFNAAVSEILSETEIDCKSALYNNIFTNCRKLKEFIPSLTYYYVTEEGLYPTSGEEVSVYQGVNPSIGTFDSDTKIYTAVALRKQCSIVTPYDPTANYYVIEGNFYVLVHPTKEEFEEDPERFYMESDFEGDPTNYYKLVPSTYLSPSNGLYPSDTLYPYDQGPSEEYSVVVSNTLGKFVRCTEDEKFNMNLTYAQVKYDDIGWREKQYVYTEVDLTEAQFNANKTKYYVLVDGEYVQCSEDDVYNKETTYYTQSSILVNTKDTWIHLDKEYYLQHPVIIEKSYTYDITEPNCSLYEEFESNLYLLIQVPEAFDSSIVVLEGDYTNTKSKKIYNSADLDMMPEALLDYLFTSKLKLMEVNTTESIPFSDALIEFLLWNAINSLDSINNNMDRLSIIMRETYPNPFKDAFRTNFWFPGFREAVFNMAEEYNNKYITDNLGYVTKSIEESLYSGYFDSGRYESSTYIDTSVN